ncbi:hypothetical protein [Belliella filtrata]|uniref:hypothetical protein n=1 Tax=Belliella filtrata TaxID=2923435 RepID=UPI00374D7E72
MQKAKELHQKVQSIKSIAKQLGSGRKTIRKYLASECLISREIKGAKKKRPLSAVSNLNY